MSTYNDRGYFVLTIHMHLYLRIMTMVNFVLTIHMHLYLRIMTVVSIVLTIHMHLYLRMMTVVILTIHMQSTYNHRWLALY